MKHGSFNLFKAGDDPNTRLMTYGMTFEHAGREYYLSGTKTIRDDKGPDLWRDTTRLYCRLHEGPDERGPVVGAGVLKLGLGELAQARLQHALGALGDGGHPGGDAASAGSSSARSGMSTPPWRASPKPWSAKPSPLREPNQEPHHEPTT